jgi:hypothetical protein
MSDTSCINLFHKPKAVVKEQYFGRRVLFFGRAVAVSA